MIMFWATLLAVSILLYVLLDGFDLGIGMLFGLAASERRRHAMNTPGGERTSSRNCPVGLRATLSSGPMPWCEDIPC